MDAFDHAAKLQVSGRLTNTFAQDYRSGFLIVSLACVELKMSSLSFYYFVEESIIENIWPGRGK